MTGYSFEFRVALNLSRVSHGSISSDDIMETSNLPITVFMFKYLKNIYLKFSQIISENINFNRLDFRCKSLTKALLIHVIVRMHVSRSRDEEITVSIRRRLTSHPGVHLITAYGGPKFGARSLPIGAIDIFFVYTQLVL